MKQRFGALMCLLLGSVLIVGGSLGTSDAGGGVTVLSCGTQLTVGNVAPPPTCPLGQIAITETSSGDQTPPANWTVTITSSNCRFPTGGTSVAVTVPNGGTKNSPDLYQNTSGTGSTACSYALSETAVSGFTATFTPAGPYTLPQAPVGASMRDVTVKNVSAVAPKPTPSTATATATVKPTASATQRPAVQVAPTPASGGTLPRTGTQHAALEISLGGGLVLLGLLLLLAGRPPRTQD
jgi:hypothetical protein